MIEFYGNVIFFQDLEEIVYVYVYVMVKRYGIIFFCFIEIFLEYMLFIFVFWNCVV